MTIRSQKPGDGRLRNVGRMGGIVQCGAYETVEFYLLPEVIFPTFLLAPRHISAIDWTLYIF